MRLVGNADFPFHGDTWNRQHAGDPTLSSIIERHQVGSRGTPGPNILHGQRLPYATRLRVFGLSVLNCLVSSKAVVLPCWDAATSSQSQHPPVSGLDWNVVAGQQVYQDGRGYGPSLIGTQRLDTWDLNSDCLSGWQTWWDRNDLEPDKSRSGGGHEFITLLEQAKGEEFRKTCYELALFFAEQNGKSTWVGGDDVDIEQNRSTFREVSQRAGLKGSDNMKDDNPSVQCTCQDGSHSHASDAAVGHPTMPKGKTLALDELIERRTDDPRVVIWLVKLILTCLNGCRRDTSLIACHGKLAKWGACMRAPYGPSAICKYGMGMGRSMTFTYTLMVPFGTKRVTWHGQSLLLLD